MHFKVKIVICLISLNRTFGEKTTIMKMHRLIEIVDVINLKMGITF